VGELFILWAALNHEAVNTGAFIASHLTEHAKPTSRVTIAEGGIIATLDRTLGFNDRINHLPVLYTPNRIDLTICLNMKPFTIVGVGQLWLSHHGHALFALPNPVKPTMTCLSNLPYEDAIVGEPGDVQGGRHDDDSDDDDNDHDDDDAEDTPGYMVI